MSTTNNLAGVTGTPGTSLSPLGGSGSSMSPILDKNAFLKLMMVQLQEQDPLNPSSQDPTQFIQQLAQMTSLEQQTNIATSSAASAQSASTTTAIALLGHTVSYIDPNGNQQTGQVQKIDMSSGVPTLTISGVSGISPGAVFEIS